MDTEQIKSRLDCKTVIEADLGQPPRRSAATNMYKCPLHHEANGFSFAVTQDGWRCFGKCDTGGDVIRWYERYHGMSFKEALHHAANVAGVSANGHSHQPPRRPQTRMPEVKPPDEKWQAAALDVVERAERYLWSPDGERALDYLITERGLLPGTIQRARLGLVPGTWEDNGMRVNGLWVWTGITIPRWNNGQLWMVNIRRPKPQTTGGQDEYQKYQMIAGSNLKGTLYGGDDIRAGVPVIFTEGEFDALIVRQIFNICVSTGTVPTMPAIPVTLGSSTNTLHERWFSALLGVPVIWDMCDNDSAGLKASKKLGAISKRVKHLPAPGAMKDVNDWYKENYWNHPAIQVWLESLEVQYA